jgi:hypothetical protein
MGRTSISRDTIDNALMNDQEISGGNLVIAKADRQYIFVSAIFGTAVTVKDADGVTKITGLANATFEHPLRLDYGCDISGTGVSVVYCVIRA